MYNSSGNNIALQYALKRWHVLKEVNNFSNPIAATLTFDCSRLARKVAEKIMTIFINKLSYEVFGNAYKRHNKRIKIFTVIEGGHNTGKQIHYHCIIETPKHIEPCIFCRVIEEIWEQRRFTSRYFNDVSILESADDLARFKDYILKTYSKSDYMDSIDILNLNII